MADIKRTELIQQIKAGSPPKSSLFIFYGERYLCQETADQLEQYLLKDTAGTVNTIDGLSEDAGQTLARLMSFSLLPGLQIYRVSESRIFQSKTVIEKIWKKAQRAQLNGRVDGARQALFDMARLGNVAITEGAPDNFSSITKTSWKKSFGFDKPDENISWADELLTAAPNDVATSTDIVESYINAFDKGVPQNNILILTAEAVDKRQRFFTYCKKNAVTVDCSIASGLSSAAKKDQQAVVQELLRNTLNAHGKTMSTSTAQLFLDRIGCHPAAVKNEAEKLALHAGDNKTIEAQAVQQLVGQTREDALFELTEALSKKQAARTMTMLGRIQEGGVHPLAILATLRNFIRKLLQIRAIQMSHTVPWQQSMSAKQFQDSYLPGLKERSEWKEFTKGHPFALYNNFLRAGQYSPANLKKQLALTLKSEYRIKSSFLPDQLILEELFISLLRMKKN